MQDSTVDCMTADNKPNPKPNPARQHSVNAGQFTLPCAPGLQKETCATQGENTNFTHREAVDFKSSNLDMSGNSPTH